MRNVVLSSVLLGLVACSAADPTGGSTLDAPPDREATPETSPPSASVNPPAIGATDPPREDDVLIDGAAADGVADDTAPVQAALAKGVALGRRVVFPAGSYRLGTTIKVSVPASARLVIAGPGATVLGAIEIAGPGEVAIAKLGFDLGSKTRGDRDALRIVEASSVDLKEVTAKGAPRWGIAIVSAGKGSAVRCRAEDNRYGGLGLEAAADFVVDGGVFSKNGTTAPIDGYGVSCMSSVIGPCTDVSITNVTAESNKRKGIDIHSGHRIAITKNTVRGFDSSGIYAVNEDPGKDVADIVIEDNVVDGTGAQHYVYGIEVGAFSSLATPSGKFVVRGNKISNTSFTTSSAIMIRNPSAGGAAPTSVLVEKNDIVNGAAPDAYVIRGDNYAVPVGEIVVRDNAVRATSAAVGIGLLRVSSATVTGNTVSIGGGYVVYGILVSSPASASVSLNTVGGGATYGTTISAP